MRETILLGVDLIFNLLAWRISPVYYLCPPKDGPSADGSVGLVRQLADDRVASLVHNKLGKKIKLKVRQFTDQLDYRAVSSVGLEHYLDRVGVTGSNPVPPTSFLK